MQKALEEALKQMQEQKPSEPMGDASEQLEQGERDEAKQSQDEAQERLLKLYDVFVQGQSMMQQSSGKAAGEKLQQTAFDLLQLSHREEIVVGALRDGGRGQNMRPLTREQGRITRATGKLSTDLEDLARQNFNIPERLLGTLRELLELSEATGEELEYGRAGRSRESARDGRGARPAQRDDTRSAQESRTRDECGRTAAARGDAGASAGDPRAAPAAARATGRRTSRAR